MKRNGSGSACCGNANGDAHLELCRAPYCYVLYGIKNIDPVSLVPFPAPRFDLVLDDSSPLPAAQPVITRVEPDLFRDGQWLKP